LLDVTGITGYDIARRIRIYDMLTREDLDQVKQVDFEAKLG
jgi:hypothetical protein